MADLTKEQLRQQNETLFPNNNSGEITAEDLRTFNDEVIDTLATENNPSLTGSVEVQGDVSASTYYGDGSNLTGVTSEVPSGTVSSSQQIVDYDVFATTGSNTFTDRQDINNIGGDALQLFGDITHVSGDYNSAGNVNAAGLFGRPAGNSTFTGSFSGDGSGLTDLTLPSGLVSGSSQVSYPELSNIPSGIVSSSDQLSLSGSDIYYNNQPTSLTSSNVQDAITELDMTKASIDSLSSNLIVYPTNATSSIAGYFRLVTSPDEEGYNTTAVNIPTGTISGSNQFIAALATTGSLFTGNPGVINITTIGNVRRVGGGSNSSADFYFEVYKRSGSVETLIATSTNTTAVNAETYEQFFATALLNNGTFTEDDVIVTKYYGNIVDTQGSDPSFDFQFGGEEPIRTLIPVPASVITDPTLTLRVNNLEIFTASQEELNSTFATTGSNTFIGDQVIEGTNLAPGNTLTVNDGNSVPRLAVQNATLAGLTGTDILLNGNLLNDGSATITGGLTLDGNISNTTGFPLTVATNGLKLNNGPFQVLNGFIYNDGAFYRGVQTYSPIVGETVTLDGQTGDYFIVNLPAGGTTTIDMSSYDQGRSFTVKIVQNGTTPATVTLGAAFKTQGGTGYTVSSGLGAVDILDVRHYDATPQDLYIVGIGQDFS